MSYERPTSADVERALTSYAETIDRAGELGLRLKRDGARLVLEQGSKTYGRAWRLYETGQPNDTTGQPCTGYYGPLVGSDYLGMTAREAHEAITTRHRVVADVLGAMRDVTREGGAR